MVKKKILFAFCQILDFLPPVILHSVISLFIKKVNKSNVV
uniref:Uncharacterized protein n=1 Tax=Anguilla anguilla TaxID=7936 RepID=A0A0E9XM26_ANGAN